MNTKLFATGFLTVVVAVFLAGCYNDSWEELYVPPPGGGGCDTTSVSFAQTVQPLLNTYCVKAPCHQTGGGGSAKKFDNYQGVKNWAHRIPGAINHEPGFQPMPQDGPLLPLCDRQKIIGRIHQGALDN